MVGERPGKLSQTWQRCLSWPSIIFPLLLYWTKLICQVVPPTYDYMHETVAEIAIREIPAWTFFFLITGTRLMFALVAPPIFLATSQILYCINKLDSMTSLSNSTRERRRSSNQMEAFRETDMILSCVMLSNWFCRMHLKFDFYLLMDSVAMQKAFNSSSHVFKTAYEVWLPPPKKPPDGFITCAIICLII